MAPVNTSSVLHDKVLFMLMLDFTAFLCVFIDSPAIPISRADHVNGSDLSQDDDERPGMAPAKNTQGQALFGARIYMVSPAYRNCWRMIESLIRRRFSETFNHFPRLVISNFTTDIAKI